MEFSIFTFITTQLLISIFILAIIPLCRNNQFIRRFGIYFAIAPFVACMLRLTLPIETAFTIVLPSYTVLTAVFSWAKSIMEAYNVKFLLFGIWISVSILLIFLLIKDIVTLNKLPRNSSNVQYTLVHNALSKVMELRGYKHTPKVIITDYIGTPFVFGYKEPLIYIPNMDYNDNELFYIIDHELIHWHNKDLWIKLLVQVICIIYWWNPVIYLLRDILSQSLEIKCDSIVSQNLDKMQKTDYLKTMIHTMENAPFKRVNNAIVTSNFVSYMSDEKAMAQRFELVYKYNNFKKNRVQALILSLVIFLLTYSVVIQPAYTVDESQYFEMGVEGSIITTENSYIIIDNGVYYLCTNGLEPIKLTESQLDLYIEVGFKIINE